MINAEQTGSNMLYIINARHLMVIIMRNKSALNLLKGNETFMTCVLY